MDPNATLRELLQAVLTSDMDRAHELAEALKSWLCRSGFSPLPAAEASYQGWKNYETWAVQRSLFGRQEIDALCRGLAAVAIAGAASCVPVIKGDWTIAQGRRHLLAESLKDLIDTRSPLVDEASVYSDLLGAALYKVDWPAIAEAFLEKGDGMTPDLFSFLPEPEGNYATRKMQQWLLADPMLSDGCREIALAKKRKRKNRERLIAEDLRRFVAQAGYEDEPPGLFRDLLDNGLKEVDWQMLAEFFLELKAPP